jgi:rhomboid family GlyGly-CTERM serine protease
VGLALTDRNAEVWRGWALPASLGLTAFVLQAGGLDVALRYERTAIAAGEFWRLVTGHFVHLGWRHLALNLIGLLLVWLLVGSAFTFRQWLTVIGVSVALVDAAFWWLSPELDWYVGLSGLLHAMLVAAALALLLRRDAAVRYEALVLLVLTAIKLGWEQFAGPMPGSEAAAGGNVVVDAHVYGAAAGLIGACLALFLSPSSGRN